MPDEPNGPVPTTVYLVDASPYIFRAFFALPSSMVSPDGAPVGAVYGFAGFLLRLLAEERPSHLAVTFDQSLTTSFRNEIYPDYKAQRELPPPELEAQQRACRHLAVALGAATFSDDRYEADDLIGTLRHRIVAGGSAVRSVIVTSDKDLAQLVGEHDLLYDFAKGERFGPAEVVEKFGVRPEQIPDYLGLAGDSVDNIPGVAGVGKKTAVALLDAFAGLDALYADLERVAELPIRGAEGLAGKLEAARETAMLSRRLATIATDAPVDASLADLAYRGADREALEMLFEELGFSERLLGRVERWRSGR